jgi:formylglycine-generating enzyme required for sulfatase activity
MKKPNSWGLYDMHGNVWQWCRDWYAPKHPGGKDPEVTERASLRVLRGGGWNNSGGDCRSALRHGLEPGYRDSDLGFRVALVQSGR